MKEANLYNIKYQEEVLERMLKTGRRNCAIHRQRQWITKLKKDLKRIMNSYGVVCDNCGYVIAKVKLSDVSETIKNHEVRSFCNDLCFNAYVTRHNAIGEQKEKK